MLAPHTRLPLGPSVLSREVELVRGANYRLQHDHPLASLRELWGLEPHADWVSGLHSDPYCESQREEGTSAPPTCVPPHPHGRVAQGVSLVLILAMLSTCVFLVDFL